MATSVSYFDTHMQCKLWRQSKYHISQWNSKVWVHKFTKLFSKKLFQTWTCKDILPIMGKLLLNNKIKTKVFAEYDLFYVIYNIEYQLLSPIKEKINQYKGFLRRMHEGKESFCGWFYLCIYPTGKNICELPRALWYIWSFLSKYFHLRNRDKIKKAYSWNILALTKDSENKYIS